MVGCGIDLYQAEPTLLPVDAADPPIARALGYLRTTQVTLLEEAETGGDYAGNWPQHFHTNVLPDYRIRDISPFMVTFIHHALALINEESVAALGLEPADAEDARAMRLAAVDFMRRFEARPDDPTAGTFGFWPHRRRFRTLRDFRRAHRARQALQGPVFRGTRSPANVSFFPPKLAIPPDADVTATVYAALLDHARLDGGSAIDPPIDRIFSDWRDLGQVPRRRNPDWLAPESGAFLTWLAYHDPPNRPKPNDVDVIVNANVLYALARYGRLDTPGAAEAIRLINDVTLAGQHLNWPVDVTDYYPDNLAYHYCIARAYHEGPVPALRPAVERLADELATSFWITPEGTAFWNRGAPHLNTAFAVLTLLNAGRTDPPVDWAVQYLIDQQDPRFGHWAESPFFLARSDSGIVFEWSSAALTTAVVIEALCRHRLAGGFAD